MFSSQVQTPAGARTIDLSSEYVLPGLIDCHTHLGSRADRYEEIDKFKSSPFDSAIAGVVNARKTLVAGFTTVRDEGALPFLAVACATTLMRVSFPAHASSPPVLAFRSPADTET